MSERSELWPCLCCGGNHPSFAATEPEIVSEISNDDSEAQEIIATVERGRERDRKTADYDRLAAENERLTSELSELKALINDDGSLTTHAEHVEELREAMHAYNVISDLANESSGWEGRARRSERENERLRARVERACYLACDCDRHGICCGGCKIHAFEAQWAAEDAGR